MAPDDTTTQDQSNPQAPAEPVAPAPEPASEVQAAPAAPQADPLQPAFDALKAVSDSLSDVIEQMNNIGDRLAELEKDVEQIKGAPFGEMLDKAFAAATEKIGGEFSTLVDDVRKMKAKLHHM